MDFFIYILPGLTAAGVLILSDWRERLNRAAPEVAQPRAAIPADIQAEIDQTPEWWLERFHDLLMEVGGHWEECICSVCYRISVEAAMDLYEDPLPRRLVYM